LSVLELVQRPDGTLSCRMPKSLEQAWTPVQHAADTDILGEYCRFDKLFFSDLPNTYRVDATLHFAPGTKNFGITMGQDFSSRHGYKYEFTPFRNQVRFGQVSRIINSTDLDRPISLDPEKPIRIRLVVDYDICTLFVNDDIALSSRMCEISSALWCVSGV
jgi:beta-fructofuranosidase